MILQLMIILPLIFAALIYFVPDKLIVKANLAFAVIICIVIFSAISMIGATPIYAMNKMLFLDSMGGIFLTIIGITGTLVTLYFPTYLSWRDLSAKRIKKMLCLAYITTFAMILSAVANDIAIMWAAIEATTLSSVFMVVYNNQKKIVEAGYKYIMVCSLGLAFAMLATILLYSSGGILFTDLIDKKIDPLTMKVIFILALVGFGTKAGLVPTHTWLPDAHAQGPSPTSAVLSGIVLKVAMLGLLRYYFIAANSAGMEFVMDTMLVSGILTLYVAGYFLVTQHDVKRMLAYHSVVHMGVIAFALGVGGRIGVMAAMFHCLAHSLTKALAFLTTGNTWRIYETNNMSKMGGLAYTAPLTCVFFGISICSLVGVPAFAIFVSEFMTFKQAILTDRYIVAIIFAIALAVIFIADFSHFFLASFGKNKNELKYDREMSVFENLPLILLSFFVIAFGVWKFEFFWNLLDISVDLIKDLR
ncbi:MAG: hydrogenase 4 subunit F [Campylobacter sp.]|nr:hydrogenase 4 subunit F [Campylobacter sp.]